MRVAYLAPFRVPYGTEFQLARAFESLGATVTMLHEATASLESIADATSGADLLLYTRSYGLNDYAPNVIALWRQLERAGTQTASFHLDLYRGLAREHEVSRDDPFWATGTVFTADGDPKSALWFELLGIRHVWCPPAIALEEAQPGQPRPDLYSCDVAFVGGGEQYGHRADWPWRAELVGHLRRRYGPRFRQWGTGGAPQVRGRALADLYATCGVAVGDSVCLLDGPGGGRHERYWSDRIVETLGRGGPLIFPRVPGVAECYGLEHGTHCWFYEYGDLDGIDRLIAEALADPQGARAVGEAGRRRLLEGGHTYRDRAALIAGTLGLSW